MKVSIPAKYIFLAGQPINRAGDLEHRVTVQSRATSNQTLQHLALHVYLQSKLLSRFYEQQTTKTLCLCAQVAQAEADTVAAAAAAAAATASAATAATAAANSRSSIRYYS